MGRPRVGAVLQVITSQKRTRLVVSYVTRAITVALRLPFARCVTPGVCRTRHSQSACDARLVIGPKHPPYHARCVLLATSRARSRLQVPPHASRAPQEHTPPTPRPDVSTAWRASTVPTWAPTLSRSAFRVVKARTWCCQAPPQLQTASRAMAAPW